MDRLMTREESYAERRQLFKDIWETSMNMDEKDDVLTKPKVIRTLRLSEMDRCVVKKKKKQKLKNLRAVCNKLLDFCDRQDADDLFYEQMAASGGKILTAPSDPTVAPKKTKKKSVKIKRKIKKAKSMFAPNVTEVRLAATTHRKHPLPQHITKHTSTMKVKQTFVSFAANKMPKTIATPCSAAHRVVVVRKNRSKKESDPKIPTNI